MIGRMLQRVGLCAGLLAGLTPAWFAAPQAVQEDEWNGLPVLSLDVVELQQYTPENVTAQELYRVAKEMVGRDFFVRERGEMSSPVSNLRTLGDSLIVYDTGAYTKTILKTLQILDVPAEETSGIERTPLLVTFEYRPRYVSLNSLQEALRPFSRQIIQFNERGETWATQNVSLVPERSLVIFRDSEKATAEVKALLQRIDVAEQQVFLTCYMIRGKKEADSAGLPKELTSNLAQLVPQYQFESIGFAMIQTAAAPGRSVQLRIEGSGTDVFELRMRPTAFDTETSSLTVDQCQVVKHEYQEITQGPGMPIRQRAGTTELFTTNTILRGGEYTVIGATGKEPVFLVIRLTPVPAGNPR